MIFLPKLSSAISAVFLPTNSWSIFYKKKNYQCTVSFTACHSCKLWLACTSPQVTGPHTHGPPAGLKRQTEIALQSGLYLDKSEKRKFLPLPDLFRKIEGDSVRRVGLYYSIVEEHSI